MPRAAAPLLLLLGAACGVRMWFAFTAPDPALVSFADRTVLIEGVVADDIEARSQGVRAVVDARTVNGEPAEGRVLVTLPRDTRMEYGDRLVVRGLIERPQSFETDTGRMFDYPGYLAARGIPLVMWRAELRSVEPGEWSVMRVLFALKRLFERALERVMREPNASLMEGLLLGEKAGLSKELTAAFVATGLVHIVVLSGYNIGIVAEWVTRVLSLALRKRTALMVAGAVIVLFALMVGGGMATARAALMGLIALLARYLDRPSAAMRALVLAGTAMVLWNPLVLFDAGFILSILATFGLIALSPWVEEKLAFVPEGAVRSIAATTIAVQLYLLPALLYFMGTLSFVSVPLNVLVLPFVPLAMLLGFLAGALALMHPYLALLPGALADTLLGVIIWITETSATLPFAAVVVPAFPAWVAALLYVPLTAFAISKYSRSAALSRSN